MQSRRGVILVVVLVVIVMLTLSVFVFSRFMQAQRRVTDTALRQTQVRLLNESGIEYLRIMLFLDQYTILALGGLYDNPDEFCGHIITDGTTSMYGNDAGTQAALGVVDPYSTGRFSIIAPGLSEEGLFTGETFRYGIEDESSKINLRWILQMDIQMPGYGRMILMRLPGVDEVIADSILDWIDDSSDQPREFGAKDEYYQLLNPPYDVRNGLPDSLDELLLVRGVTARLLYGNDWNRNGLIDPGEPDGFSLDEYLQEDYDVLNGSLNLGLISYLTLDSRESIITPDGLTPAGFYYKININMEDLDELRAQLDERFPENPDWANYIISYRQQANQSQGSNDSALGDIISALLFGAEGESDGKVNSLFDLVGGQGSPFSDDPFEIEEYMPILYDNLMLKDTPSAGRINLNQAPRTVLELLAARDDELTDTAALLGEGADALLGTALMQIDVQEIIERILEERICDPAQIALEAPEMNYPFWIYTHGIVPDLETMRQLEPYFCTQGAVFKATVISRFDEKSPVSRVEVWLDASEGTGLPKIIRIRDISDLGPGYSAELLGADTYVR